MIKSLCSKSHLQLIFPPCAALELMGSAGYKMLFSYIKKLHKTKLELLPWCKLVWFFSAGAWEPTGARPTHQQPQVTHCSSLGKPGPTAQGPGSTGDEGRAASHIVLTGVHLLHQGRLPVWDAAPPPTVSWSAQARTFHRRSQVLWTHLPLHGHGQGSNDKYTALVFI